MKEFHIHEIANEINTSDYKIEVQLEVQANADALRASSSAFTFQLQI